MRSIKVIGGDDDQGHRIDQIGCEPVAFLLVKLCQCIVCLLCVGDDVALRVRGAVLIVHVEQRLQIAFLNVFAEKCGVAFTECQPGLRGDAAQLVSGLDDQSVQQTHPFLVMFEVAQRGDDD